MNIHDGGAEMILWFVTMVYITLLFIDLKNTIKEEDQK